MQLIRGEEQHTVLVAEPQALLGMWLEDILVHAGYAVSGPYGTCDEAAGSLDAAPPDFAIVSVDLNQGPGFPLACALRRRGIPFALISGSAQVPGAFSDVPLFDRLFDAAHMVGTVTTCRASRQRREGIQACPMLGRIKAGETFALDQCPTACSV